VFSTAILLTATLFSTAGVGASVLTIDLVTGLASTSSVDLAKTSFSLDAISLNSTADSLTASFGAEAGLLSDSSVNALS